MFRMIAAVLPGCVPISGVYNIKMCQDALPQQQIFAAACAPKAAFGLRLRTPAVLIGSERYQDSSLRPVRHKLAELNCTSFVSYRSRRNRVVQII
jgi:hypothetical protein